MEPIKEKSRARTGKDRIQSIEIRLQKPVLNKQQNNTGWGSVSISIYSLSLIIKRKQAATKKPNNIGTKEVAKSNI